MGKKIDRNIFVQSGKKGAAATLKSQGPGHYARISKNYWDKKKKKDNENNH